MDNPRTLSPVRSERGDSHHPFDEEVDSTLIDKSDTCAFIVESAGTDFPVAWIRVLHNVVLLSYKI